MSGLFCNLVGEYVITIVTAEYSRSQPQACHHAPAMLLTLADNNASVPFFVKTNSDSSLIPGWAGWQTKIMSRCFWNQGFVVP